MSLKLELSILSAVLVALGVTFTTPAVDPRAEASVTNSPDYDLARTGIEWSQGLDSALDRGKPVLLFQLLGDFAKVHC